jgi:UDP-3-O-[3-hydroxymyristoyl] glucosamine N-acyltransferase
MLHGMQISVTDLAARIGGTVEGNGTLPLAGIASIPRAKSSDVTFVGSTKHCAAAEASAAGAIIVPRNGPASGKPLIRVDNPKSALARALAVFHPPRRYPATIHPTAQLGADVKLGNDLFIGEYAVVRDGAMIGDRTVIEAGCFVGEGAVLGADCLLYPGVKLYHAVKIGRGVIIHAGAVIGSDGFGYAQERGQHVKIPQIGDVIIGDDVEIGANTTIDRAMIDSTIIHRGTKIDNLVQIAHDVTIGECSIIVAQVGIAGSCEIGRNVTLAGQVGVGDHRNIGDNAVVGGGAGVTDDLPADSVVWGTPAQPMLQYKRQLVALRRLPKVLWKLAQRGILDDGSG